MNSRFRSSRSLCRYLIRRSLKLARHQNLNSSITGNSSWLTRCARIWTGFGRLIQSQSRSQSRRGYFNPQAFAMVADRLERLEGVRLLLGAEPVPPPAIPLRMPGEPRGEKYDALLVNTELKRNDEGLKRDRDFLPFTPEVDRSVRRLLDFLKATRSKCADTRKRSSMARRLFFQPMKACSLVHRISPPPGLPQISN